MKHVIAIDGCSGSGKGTLSQKLASFFGLAYLDSGSMYRAFACMKMALSNNLALDCVSEKDPDFFESLSDILRIDDESKENNDKINVDSHCFVSSIKNIPENILRSEIVGMEESLLAKSTEIRDTINGIMRDFALDPGGDYSGTIADGRDIGTVVFPDATCKIFLTASLDVRADRRFKYIKETDSTVTFEEIYENLKNRDEEDSSRSIAPLSFDKSYVVVDTSKDSIEESFDKLKKIIELYIEN